MMGQWVLDGEAGKILVNGINASSERKENEIELVNEED